MTHQVDLQGEGPVRLPEDLLSPFGWMMDAFWHVHDIRLTTKGMAYFREFSASTFAMNDIMMARDAVRHERIAENERFERLLEAESVRQRNVRIEAELRDPELGNDGEEIVGQDPDMLYDAWRERELGL